MRGLLNFVGISVISMASVFAASVSMAAESGRAAQNVRTVSAGAFGAAPVSAGATVRMPSMPTMPLHTLGNLTVDLPQAQKPVVPPTPDDPKPDDPKPDDPKPDEPTPPAPECPDGGVKNSDYTIDKCMYDVLMCVNTGGLANGINDMFDESKRNEIMNDMGLCRVQIERCVREVRRDCENVYRSASDVWIDFNSRKVQPEYYNLVLRKTGLTPNQAEHVCRLLDKNTYGSSFAAVANNGAVTAEYNNKIGAYNNQHGNVLVKTQPLGPQVNDNNPGVDGQRGHYARWDATTGTCYIRVAAYNKDKHISNSWLFGAAGDDRAAEIWLPAGDTFNCNKNLFGFSLMNQTSTAAVVGIAGGTVVGAGVGALAGHGKRDIDCTNPSHLKQIAESLQSAGKVGILNQYLDTNSYLSVTGGSVTTAQCEKLVALYNVHKEYVSALNKCSMADLGVEEYFEASLKCTNYTNIEQCFQDAAQQEPAFANCIGKGFQTPQECVNLLEKMQDEGSLVVDVAVEGDCTFKPLNKSSALGLGIYCSGSDGCKTPSQIQEDVKELGNVLDDIAILRGEKSNVAKSMGIGAAIGAGTGGIATAITAMVEHGNINCRVGDGLAQVGLGKSHSIGNLRDFYVKWNLRLPDTVAPTATITTCANWRETCGKFTDLNQCKSAEINYMPAGAKTSTLVRAACVPSGSACVENYPVAKSYGACE